MITRSGQGDSVPSALSSLSVSDSLATGSVTLSRRGRGYPSEPHLRDHIRLSRLPRRLRHQPLEATLQHLAHHREVIAWRELGRADVELAILIFAEALGAGDDHSANRIRALDVAVVVDLDAARRARKAEALPERREQLALRRGVCKLAAERLARIGERMG